MKALKDNDINEFRQILYQNKDVIDQTWDKNNYRSIFETACQTPGRYEFVLECIDFGCDVNKVNNVYSVFNTLLYKILYFICRLMNIFKKHQSILRLNR